jgi:hypothetical protein
LQFNRDAEERGLVICKCYRFAFYTPQLKDGGCAEMVARPDEPKEPGPEDQLRAVLRGFKPKLTDAQVDGYVKTLIDNMVDLDTLKNTFSDTTGKGKEDVFQSLLRAGVQPEGMVLRLANAISDLVLRERERERERTLLESTP